MNPLIREASDLIRQHRLRIWKVLKRAGLNDTAFSYWKRGGNPTLANFEAFLNAMGYHLEIEEHVPVEDNQQCGFENEQTDGLADPMLHIGGQAQSAHTAVDQCQDRR